MTYLAWYTCAQEILPCIEAALAANGYVAVGSPRWSSDGTALVVMECGAVQVLLGSCPERADAMIEVWGDAQAAAVNLLESLPFVLTRQACVQR